MNKPRSSKATKYSIPKNLCQSCYENKGRFILHCFCIICQKCFKQTSPFYKSQRDQLMCSFCDNPTASNVIDCTKPQSIGKLQFLFKNMNKTFNDTIEAYKFQDTIRKRYCLHLERKIKLYHDTIMDFVKINPHLQTYFQKKLKMTKKEIQGQMIKQNRNRSLPISKNGGNTAYSNKNSQTGSIASIRSKFFGDAQINMNHKNSKVSSSQCNFQPNKIKRKIDYQKNFSGNNKNPILRENPLIREEVKVDFRNSKEVIRGNHSENRGIYSPGYSKKEYVGKPSDFSQYQYQANKQAHQRNNNEYENPYKNHYQSHSNFVLETPIPAKRPMKPNKETQEMIYQENNYHQQNQYNPRQFEKKDGKKVHQYYNPYQNYDPNKSLNFNIQNNRDPNQKWRK